MSGIMQLLLGTAQKAAARGVFGGGNFNNQVAQYYGMSYITISTLGNSTNFGNLDVGMSNPTSCASATRGIFSGGRSFDGANFIVINNLQYITIATTGNATDFGDLNSNSFNNAGFNSSTRGVFAIGDTDSGGTRSNVIDYVTIATTGNATDFGDLIEPRSELCGFSSSTRGIFAGGSANAGAAQLRIQYVTIATTGNATNFGDLNVRVIRTQGGCSNATRGLMGGTATASENNTIQYVTIATTGNATDFGDLTVGRYFLGSCSDSIRGVFGGGTNNGSSSGAYNILDYVTIASAGNATDFGDFATILFNTTALSNQNGGTQ